MAEAARRASREPPSLRVVSGACKYPANVWGDEQDSHDAAG